MKRINQFRLFAHGEFFNVDTYVASSPLKFDGIWHKGEFRKKHPKSSGVFKELGDGQTIYLYEQEKIAIEYLSVNREAIKALSKYPGVTTVILGLEYYVERKKVPDGFVMGPSPLLMWHSLNTGVTPNFYVTVV